MLSCNRVELRMTRRLGEGIQIIPIQEAKKVHNGQDLITK